MGMLFAFALWELGEGNPPVTGQYHANSKPGLLVLSSAGRISPLLTTKLLSYLTHWGLVTPGASVSVVIIGLYIGLLPLGAKTLSKSMIWFIINWTLDIAFSDVWIKNQQFNSRKLIWKCRLQRGPNFVPAAMCHGKVRITFSVLMLRNGMQICIFHTNSAR